MSFIFHLMEKDAEDYTGPEQKIKQLISTEAIKWLPLGRSKMIEDFGKSDAREDILERVLQQNKGMAQQFDELKKWNIASTKSLENVNRMCIQQMDALEDTWCEVQAHTSRLSEARQTENPRTSVVSGVSGMIAHFRSTA